VVELEDPILTLLEVREEDQHALEVEITTITKEYFHSTKYQEVLNMTVELMLEAELVEESAT